MVQKKVKNNVDIKFDIPQGLVASRREQLIKMGLPGYGVREERDATPPAKLEHLTLARPVLNDHRPPSRHSRTQSSTIFFANNEQNQPQMLAEEHTDLLSELKTAIATARNKYLKHYQQGIDSRETNGWFSWARHGAAGQLKAEQLFEEWDKCDEVDSILSEMDNFFSNPDIKYNNHSKATYFLDELNKISLPSYKPEKGAHYDVNSWKHVKEQLQKIELNEKTNNHYAGDIENSQDDMTYIALR